MYLGGIDGGVAFCFCLFKCNFQEFVLELVTHLYIKSSIIFSFRWLKWRRKTVVIGIFLPRGGVGGWVKALCEWSLPKYLLFTSFVQLTDIELANFD